MLDPRLANQSLSRPLTECEQSLARALEEIFGMGEQSFPAVAAALQAKGVERPSGVADGWTAVALEAELEAINASLDQAYASRGIGA